MNLVQLRYFVAVARSKNLSRAAAELHVSQPAITRQLKLLQAELDVVLLSRNHRGIELTDAGRALLERAEFQIQSFDQMRSEIRDLSFAPTGRIQIGCPPSLTRQIMARPVRTFLTRFPNVAIEVKESISDELARAVVSDRLDIAVVSTLSIQPHLVSELLFREPIWLFGAPGNPRRKVQLRDLANLPLLMTHRNNATRDMVERQMANLSLPMNIVVETDSTQFMEELVKGGLGFVPAPYFTFIDKVKSGELAGGPIEDLSIDRLLIRRKDRPATKAIQEFLKLLRPELERASRSVN